MKNIRNADHIAQKEKNMKKYTEMSKCVACGSSHLLQYMDLHAQPLANNYHKISEIQDNYPLSVNVCQNCYHSQLSIAVDPDVLYKHYLYVSGTTKTLIDYFKWFVETVEKQMEGRKLNVLDIACNDGSLLACFLARGHTVQGVDPAENLAPLAREKNVPVLTAYWNRETAKKFDKPFDIIIAMNVLGHVSNPLDFLKGCHDCLAPGGRVFIQTSQAEMVARKEFDTVYHEHHSFFNMRSFEKLCHRSSFYLISACKTPVHGTSYLWTLSCDDVPVSETVKILRHQEEISGYYEIPTYRKYMESVQNTATEMKKILEEYRNKNYRIVGYGAAAKGNTFLNFSGIDLEYIVDDNPLKVGLLTPGRNIPIVDSHCLTEDDRPTLIVVLAWNFFDEVRQRVMKARTNKNDIFVTYYPEIRISI